MDVSSTSLNYRDPIAQKGGGRGSMELGVVPLSNDADKVAAICEGVMRVEIDDRIVG
jgi:hypothetical protein